MLMHNENNDEGGNENKYVTTDQLDEMLKKNTTATLNTITTKIDSSLNGFSNTFLKQFENHGKKNEEEKKMESDDDIESMLASLDPNERKVLERLADSVADKKLSAFEKRLDEKFGNHGKEVMEKTLGVLSEKEKRSAINDDLVTSFPQILDENSDLRVKAQSFLKQLPEEFRQTAEAQDYAVLRAAKVLGIQPTKHASVVNGNNINGHGGGDGHDGGNEKFSDSDIDYFATRFGIRNKKDFKKGVNND